MCPPYKVLDADPVVGEEVVNAHIGTTCVHLNSQVGEEVVNTHIGRMCPLYMVFDTGLGPLLLLQRLIGMNKAPTQFSKWLNARCGGLILRLPSSCCLASFPGPTQLPVTYRTASDGKLGGTWERG